MIRATVPADTPELLALAEGTLVFKPHEIVALNEVLDDYHDTNHAEQHRCVTVEEDGQIIGFAYYAPAAMTERTWYLYWIAVRVDIQTKGTGSRLMAHVEEDIRNKQGRLLLIETSSLPHYSLTRRFYEKLNYEKEAVIRDFYADHDDLVVFRKRLN
ncbi:MAG: GNAT family N-acetyltransferase [Planctomycetia bacterium]|nr:GNAT family N-acetyltransferase [Planctomycetia bacterium]